MRRACMVVTKKKFIAANKDLVAPLSTSPFNFSLGYYYLLQSKIPFEVFQVSLTVPKYAFLGNYIVIFVLGSFQRGEISGN